MAATRRKNSIHMYECSNWFNEYSSQRYPLHIDDVSFVDITSKKTPQRNPNVIYGGVSDLSEETAYKCLSELDPAVPWCILRKN